MGRRFTPEILVGLFDSIVRPERFVATDRTVTAGSVLQQARQTVVLLLFYAANLILYAGPLTLTGVGVPEATTAPPAVALLVGGAVDPAAAWAVTRGFLQNSAFITVLSALTFVTYHAALVVTLSSQGFLLTLHTVVYTTSAYLAAIFTVLVSISQNARYEAAQELVVELQVRFITLFYDAFDVAPAQRVFQPGETVPVEALTGPDVTILTVLVVLVLYFLYSLYLGIRINHRGSRFSALAGLAAVVSSPAIYVSGLILWSIGRIPV